MEAGGGGDDGSSTIGKQTIGDNLLRVPSIRHMQTAELDGAEEDHRFGIHLGKGMGHTYAIQCAVATHESDVCALNTRSQLKLVDQEQINTG